MRIALRQMAKQDSALASRQEIKPLAAVSLGQTSSNIRLVRSSDGSKLPAYDFSASELPAGKRLEVMGNSIQTKVAGA